MAAGGRLQLEGKARSRHKQPHRSLQLPCLGRMGLSRQLRARFALASSRAGGEGAMVAERRTNPAPCCTPPLLLRVRRGERVPWPWTTLAGKPSIGDPHPGNTPSTINRHPRAGFAHAGIEKARED